MIQLVLHIRDLASVAAEQGIHLTLANDAVGTLSSLQSDVVYPATAGRGMNGLVEGLQSGPEKQSTSAHHRLH